MPPFVDLPQPAIRLLRALNHPLRRRILFSLINAKRSAVTLASEYDRPANHVHYHLKDILDKECKVVEVVETRSNQKIYTLRKESFFGVLSALPEPVRSGLQGVSASQFLSTASAAFEGGTIESLRGSRLEWRPLDVDDLGWQAVSDAAAQFEKAVSKAEKATRQREILKEGGRLHRVIVGVAAFGGPTQ